MKLVFLGTRGEIEARTRRHRMHSSLLLYRSPRVMIDCGLDWLGKFERLQPSAIVLTHAHPDHAWGLKHGAPCPVHAPEKTWQTLQGCTVKERHLIKERTPTKICGIMFEAFPVEHSILAPVVWYRVSARQVSVFYAPDLIFIDDRAAALKGVQIYIGDGAALTRSFIRKCGIYRACTSSHAAGVVQKGGRAAGDHYSLRVGDRHRRRTRGFGQAPRNSQRARPRSAYRLRRDEIDSPIRPMRELVRSCGWTRSARRIEILV